MLDLSRTCCRHSRPPSELGKVSLGKFGGRGYPRLPGHVGWHCVPQQRPVDVSEEGMRFDVLGSCHRTQPLLDVTLQQLGDQILQLV